MDDGTIRENSDEPPSSDNGTVKEPPSFNGKTLRELFSSEASIRENPDAFRRNSFQILDDRELPMAHVALTMYLTVITDNPDDKRKDKETPREQHEQSHVDAADKLIKVVGTDWLRPKKYGSLDAFFTAIVLHDIIEDFNVSEDAISGFLESGLKNLLKVGGIDKKTYDDSISNLPHAIGIVSLLSRKNADGSKIAENDRIAQAQRWLEHPYAYLIKLIDWSNKLQTMVGVDHFEGNGLDKMNRTLSETGLLFVDEQQGMTEQAIQKYPFLKKVCTPLEGIMGMQFQTLRTYKLIRTGDVMFDPQSKHVKGLNFDKYLALSKQFLEVSFTGNNYIGPMIDRISKVGETDERVAAYVEGMVKPAFKDHPYIFSK